MTNNAQTNYGVPVAIIIAGILIAGAVYFSTSKGANTVAVNNQQGQQVAQQQGVAVDGSKVKTDGEPFVGNPNAPVVVAEWFDYQCPFCKRFDSDAIAQLMTDYIKTGKVKLVFKDFQFLGADSQTAGLAGRAIWEVAPDKFYDWHKAMFEKQDGENIGWGNKTDILALTQSLGIDSVKVEQLMSSKAVEYQRAMDADKAEGGSFGINGTPGTIIGKNIISGAQPYSAVKQLVDLALQNK
ncbi:MAG: thioredoxin domain-containing protein [bacterium]|nr:thioredoxin domain-containing protein [bacterium]